MSIRRPQNLGELPCMTAKMGQNDQKQRKSVKNGDFVAAYTTSSALDNLTSRMRGSVTCQGRTRGLDPSKQWGRVCPCADHDDNDDDDDDHHHSRGHSKTLKTSRISTQSTCKWHQKLRNKNCHQNLLEIWSGGLYEKSYDQNGSPSVPRFLGQNGPKWAKMGQTGPNGQKSVKKGIFGGV